MKRSEPPPLEDIEEKEPKSMKLASSNHKPNYWRSMKRRRTPRYRPKKRVRYQRYRRYRPLSQDSLEREKDWVGRKQAYYAGVAAGELKDADNLTQKLDKRGTKESLGFFGPSYKLATPKQRLNRQMYKFKGKGDYRSWAKWIPRGLGALMGGLGSSWANPTDWGGVLKGAETGWQAGANISKDLLGWGDYTTTNAIVNSGESMPGNAKISVNDSGMQGDVFIEHTEFVTNIWATGSASTASAFELRRFELNPGNDGVFPFLSQMASNYVMYEWQGLIFQYRPTSGDDSGSMALGKIIMTTEYDPDASSFPNSMVMANNSFSQTFKPTCGGIHGVETHPQHCQNTILYVRNGASALQKAKNFTDLGVFFLATEGIPINAAGSPQLIGELWVTYRCRLIRPNLSHSILGENINADNIKTSHTNALSVSAVTYKNTNTLGVTVTSTANNSRIYTFPERRYGTFMFYIETLTATASFVYSTSTLSAGVVQINPYNYATGAGQQLARPAGTNVTTVFFINIPPTVSGTPTVQVNHTALTDSGSTDFTIITEIPRALAFV